MAAYLVRDDGAQLLMKYPICPIFVRTAGPAVCRLAVFMAHPTQRMMRMYIPARHGIQIM
ncbi:hypothetical protein X759_05855 [Mesorhizobium sp. LSHC420B00]|nr:hypothetical protein X759_05855 [Mesorhizobium sp. LSHC420B00]